MFDPIVLDCILLPSDKIRPLLTKSVKSRLVAQNLEVNHEQHLFYVSVMFNFLAIPLACVVFSVIQ